MQLSPKQVASVVEADAEVCIWHGSVRSGKTYASVIAFLGALARTPPGSVGQVVIVGRTLDTIYRNVISTAIDIVGTGSDGVRYTRGAGTAVILGHTVEIIGASDARAETRIRGMTIRILYVDEGSILPDHQYWMQLLNRQLTVENSRTYLTTNPDHPMHWLKVEVIDLAEELGYRVWHFNMDDNPALTEKAKAQARLFNTGVFYDRNVLGLWRLAHGTIWPLDESRHIVTDADLPAMQDYVVGVDYGAHSTHAALLMGLGVDHRLYFLAEYRWDYKLRNSVTLTDVDLSRALLEWLDVLDPATNAVPSKFPGARTPYLTLVDHEPSFHAQLKRDGWGNVRNADKSVLDGIRTVASMLAADRVRIHESCTGLLTEIPGYVWDEDADVDRPTKVNDHSCDAARYAVMGTRRWWRHWLALDAALDTAA